MRRQGWPGPARAQGRGRHDASSKSMSQDGDPPQSCPPAGHPPRSPRPWLCLSRPLGISREATPNTANDFGTSVPQSMFGGFLAEHSVRTIPYHRPP